MNSPAATTLRCRRQPAAPGRLSHAHALRPFYSTFQLFMLKTIIKRDFSSAKPPNKNGHTAPPGPKALFVIL